MLMETPSCNLCDSKKSRAELSARDENYDIAGEFHVVKCLSCGLVYLSPRPTLEAIGDCYPFNYGEHNATGEPGPLHRAEASRVCKWAGGDGVVGVVLDVGCAAGYFLRAMRDVGWQVSGIEPDPVAAERASVATGGRVRSGMLHEGMFEAKSFDVITLWSVIEHLHDPMSTLKTARGLLRDGGKLHLGMPNFGSLERRLFRDRWFALDLPRHLYHFTPTTLGRMLDSAGFKILDLTHSSGHDNFKRSLRPSLRLRSDAAIVDTFALPHEDARESFARRVRRCINRVAVSGFVSFADATRQGSQLLVVAESK